MNITARTGLAIAAAVGPLLLVGCSSGSSTAESAASGAESIVGGPQADSGDCAATQVYGDDASLFGREWLLAFKQNPSTPVSLLRCHYVHNPNADGDQLAPDAHRKAMTGDLVSPPVIIPGGAEVQKILLSLPDSTDLGHRCPVPQPVVDFDEFRVLDQSGTAVAKFQTSESGNGCGVFRVIPSA
ncbi:hypothetical protein ABIC73_004321 [Prescottella equi]|uniref:hypothetical protein n=1 Tax=Rhodococcus hoagii TaxID=43767 RepID=UPI00339539BF